MTAKLLPPYLSPVDITKDDANQKIKEMGELSRAMIAFDLVCLEHGVFAREVQEDDLELEERKHRIGEGCWHELSIRNHEVI